MLWGQRVQVALPSNYNLQRLPNPPNDIGRQSGAMTPVETVNGLHHSAYGLLLKVRIADSVMVESFGDVGGEADVGRREPTLAMDVAVMELADAGMVADVVIAIVAD